MEALIRDLKFILREKKVEEETVKAAVELLISRVYVLQNSYVVDHLTIPKNFDIHEYKTERLFMNFGKNLRTLAHKQIRSDFMGEETTYKIYVVKP